MSRPRSLENLPQHSLNFRLQRPDLGLDLRQRPRRLVPVEVPGEGDLVADLRLLLVDPGVGDVRQDLALEVGVDVVLQRTFSLSRRSASGSRRPFASRQISAFSSRSDRADRTAFRTGVGTATPSLLEAPLGGPSLELRAALDHLRPHRRSSGRRGWLPEAACPPRSLARRRALLLRLRQILEGGLLPESLDPLRGKLGSSGGEDARR